MQDEYNPLKMVSGAAGKPKAEGDADEWMLPDLSKGYQAHARPSNKPVYALHCVLSKEGYRTFQFVHIDSNISFGFEKGGQVIVLRFAGLKPVTVIIRGTNLKRLYDYLGQHRMPWIARVEPGRDFSRGDEPVITAIDIEPYEDKPVVRAIP